jgi:hypothetical protein
LFLEEENLPPAEYTGKTLVMIWYDLLVAIDASEAVQHAWDCLGGCTGVALGLSLPLIFSATPSVPWRAVRMDKYYVLCIIFPGGNNN